MKDLEIVHDPSYEGWVFDHHHPTQGRRFTNGYNQVIAHADAAGLSHNTIGPFHVTDSELQLAHTPEYIDQVLTQHTSNEWRGERSDLSTLASLFAGGTLAALWALQNGETLTAVHLPGAKHHAMANTSSGFCVFNDFAIAARLLANDGFRVAILDVDAHHGDGVEALCLDEPDILTYSIHQYGIFPGTGLTSDDERNALNWPLPARAGDRDLRDGVADFLLTLRAFKPHYIFITGGADGHKQDPLAELEYSLDGMESAMRMVRSAYDSTPILFGGAGGYQPDGATPLAWARMVTALAS